MSLLGRALLLSLLFATVPVSAQPSPRPDSAFSAPGTLQKMPSQIGPSSPPRQIPPRAGAKRCIGVDTVAGAILYGDRSIEMVMKSGQRWRLYLARSCPALSFYQGFYYRRGQNGRLCAGRDAIIARSGGACDIASIMPLGRIKRP